MEKLAGFLQAVGYHAVLVQPLLPMNFHLILSALFPIYAGAHASLSRPSSAAKPPKRKKGDDDTDDSDEHRQKMEGMSPSDAIILPLLAGATLAGLYFLIKWLEDPTILNKFLNWYFSIFGVLALARLMTDVTGTVRSYIFPIMYTSGNQIWMIDRKQEKAILIPSRSATRDSPLPGRLALLPLKQSIVTLLWKIRGLSHQRLQVRFFIRKIIYAKFKIGPQGCVSFLIALAAQVYYNFIDKPWWLTNALGFSFAYNALQLISPTDSWTGTLILIALFVYDIYFVFFTPLMVTVATKLEIPAKLLFPRPSGPNDDPAKQAMSMLGLGDIVLPGMMIGFALRFDLYLFYLQKQTRKEDEKPTTNIESVDPPSSRRKEEDDMMEKDTWYPATGGWGERFWTSRKAIVTSEQLHGIIFPKTYFHASLTGYVIGMLVTLGVMQIFRHAQPALLYLVPGVLGALWGTALFKGDIKTLWAFSEADEENVEEKSDKGKTKEGDEDGSSWPWSNWGSVLFDFKRAKKEDGRPGEGANQQSNSIGLGVGESEENVSDLSNPRTESFKDHELSGCLNRDQQNELLFFSISVPDSKTNASSSPNPSKSTT